MEKPLPTDAELAVLQVLWSRGSATVREVHDALSATSEAGYTSVLKTMQIMTDKGLVVRDDSQRSHVYRAAVKEESTQKRLVGRLIERVFEGSAARLAMRALSTAPSSPEELEQVRALVDALAKKGEGR